MEVFQLLTNMLILNLCCEPKSNKLKINVFTATLELKFLDVLTIYAVIQRVFCRMYEV